MCMINEGKINVIKQKLQDIEKIIGSIARDIWSEDDCNYRKRMDDSKELQYLLECVDDASNRVELIEWKMEKEQV